MTSDLSSALYSLLEEEGDVENKGEEIARRMRSVQIYGIDGPVIMNSNGDRLDEYSIMRLEEGREEYSPVLVYTAHHRQLVGVAGQEMRWPTNCSNPVYRQVVERRLGTRCGSNTSHMAPLDYPLCGPLGELCQSEAPNFAVIVSVILSVLLVMFIIIGYLVYRHYREEAAIASMHWKISQQDIIATKGARGRIGSTHSLNQSMDSIGVGEDVNRQMFIKTVHYKGNVVAMKEMKSTPLTRSLMMELKTLKDLQHMNIVRFLGASLDPGNAGVIFFSYYSRDYKVTLRTTCQT